MTAGNKKGNPGFGFPFSAVKTEHVMNINNNLNLNNLLFEKII